MIEILSGIKKQVGSHADIDEAAWVELEQHIKYMQEYTGIVLEFINKKYTPRRDDITFLSNIIAGYRYSITPADINGVSFIFERVPMSANSPAIKKDTITLKNNENLFYELDKWISKLHDVGIDSKGSIYLVSDGVYTKIGATSYNVKKRLNELQTGNAKKLSIIGSYNVENKLTTEAHLHKMFASKHVLGEWFLLNDDDIYRIMSERPDIKRSNCFYFLTPSDVENIKISMDFAVGEYCWIAKIMKERALHKNDNDVSRFKMSIPLKNRLYLNKTHPIAKKLIEYI